MIYLVFYEVFHRMPTVHICNWTFEIMRTKNTVSAHFCSLPLCTRHSATMHSSAFFTLVILTLW